MIITNDILFFILFIFFTIISLVLFMVKNKGVELIGIHTIVWLCILVIGVTIMIDYNLVLMIMFLFINTVIWIGNILSVEA
jgi:hypothetical protein